MPIRALFLPWNERTSEPLHPLLTHCGPTLSTPTHRHRHATPAHLPNPTLPSSSIHPDQHPGRPRNQNLAHHKHHNPKLNHPSCRVSTKLPISHTRHSEKYHHSIMPFLQISPPRPVVKIQPSSIDAAMYPLEKPPAHARTPSSTGPWRCSPK